MDLEHASQVATRPWQKRLLFGVGILGALGGALAALTEVTGYSLRDLVSPAKPVLLSASSRAEVRGQVEKAATDGSVSADEREELKAFVATLGAESAAAEAYAAELGPALAQAIREQQQGTELGARGRFAEARQHFREATRLDPSSAVAWANFGGVALELGDLAEAELALRKALALDPGSLEANYNFGQWLAMQNQSEAALSHLERAIQTLLVGKSIFEPRALRRDLQENGNFAALRSSPRFAALIRQIR